MRWTCMTMAVVIASGALTGCSSGGGERTDTLDSPLDTAPIVFSEDQNAVCYVCTVDDFLPDVGDSTPIPFGSDPSMAVTAAGTPLRGTKAAKLACTSLKLGLELLQTAVKLLNEFAALAKEIGSAVKVWSITKDGKLVRVAWTELTRGQKITQLIELGVKFGLAKVSYDKAMEEYERAKTAKVCDADLDAFKKKADELFKLAGDFEKTRAEREQEERRLYNKENFGTPGF